MDGYGWVQTRVKLRETHGTNWHTEGRLPSNLTAGSVLPANAQSWGPSNGPGHGIFHGSTFRSQHQA